MVRLRVVLRTAVSFLLLASSVPCLHAQPRPIEEEKPYFIAYGTVFEIDLAARSVQSVGKLDRTALSVARDSGGRYWSRYRGTSLASYDPATKAVTARIPLGDAPYHIVIASHDRAYVSHNTLTPMGFTMSVVDLAAGASIRRIDGIPGLVTDMLLAGGSIYAVAYGVGQSDSLSLFRIDTRTQALSEIFREARREHSWRLQLWNGTILLIPVRSPLAPTVEDSRSVVIGLPVSGGPPREYPIPAEANIERIVGGGKLTSDALLLPVRERGGGYSVAAFDPVDFRMISRAPLSRPVDDLLFADGHLCVGRTNLLLSGPGGVTLVFIDREKGKEVKDVPLLPNVAD